MEKADTDAIAPVIGFGTGCCGTHAAKGGEQKIYPVDALFDPCQSLHVNVVRQRQQQLLKFRVIL
jgi:hypothetical protein